MVIMASQPLLEESDTRRLSEKPTGFLVNVVILGSRRKWMLLVCVVLTAMIVFFTTFWVTSWVPLVILPTPSIEEGPVSSTESATDSHSCKCTELVSLTLLSGQSTLEQLDEKISFLNHTTMDYLTRNHPNVPSKLIHDMAKENRCDLMPSLFSINWHNVYWQQVELSDKASFLLYSALYDNRTQTAIRPCVRLLGVSNVENPPHPYCLLWFNVTGPPESSKVIRIDYLDYQKKSETREMPYMLTCRVPASMAAYKPEAVSLVPTPCSPATNLLHVEGAGEREPSAYLNANSSLDPTTYKGGYNVAVCGPALYYYHKDFSHRMVEWLETLRVQGISRVFLYETDVHINLQKVLRYYEEEGFVQVTKYTYPSTYVNDPSLRRLWTLVERQRMWAQENVYFTDCVLRHQHQYRFIAHYDPDELPTFIQHTSYIDFLNQNINKDHQSLSASGGAVPAGYRLHWRIFYDDLQPPARTENLPAYLYMKRHIMTPKRDISNLLNHKTVFDMDYVTGIYSHDILFCNNGKCPSYSKNIPRDEAFLAHFTWTCGLKCKIPGILREETALLVNLTEVQEAVTKVLSTLNLL